MNGPTKDVDIKKHDECRPSSSSSASSMEQTLRLCTHYYDYASALLKELEQTRVNIVVEIGELENQLFSDPYIAQHHGGHIYEEMNQRVQAAYERLNERIYEFVLAAAWLEQRTSGANAANNDDSDGNEADDDNDIINHHDVTLNSLSSVSSSLRTGSQSILADQSKRLASIAHPSLLKEESSTEPHYSGTSTTPIPPTLLPIPNESELARLLGVFGVQQSLDDDDAVVSSQQQPPSESTTGEEHNLQCGQPKPPF